MKEYIKSRFSKGDVVRNKQTGEDGKIDSVSIDDDGRVTYAVHLPTDPHGWEMGTKGFDVPWDDAYVDTSPNEHLK